MRSRHGSARNGVDVGIAVDPRGSNVGTGSENVHEKAEVGVGGSSVVFVAGADGADFGGGGRGGGDGGETGVSGCDGEEEALVDGFGYCGVGCGAEEAAEREVCDGFSDATFGFGVVDGPVCCILVSGWFSKERKSFGRSVQLTSQCLRAHQRWSRSPLRLAPEQQ